MDKEKEIEEMVKIARKYSEKFANTPYYKGVKTDMEAIYEAGYRKADEVRKETAKEILCYLKATMTDGLLKNHEILNALMREYGVEVEE